MLQQTLWPQMIQVMIPLALLTWVSTPVSSVPVVGPSTEPMTDTYMWPAAVWPLEQIKSVARLKHS